MLSIAQGLLIAIWNLLLEMAPYLLFGFSIAGLLHVLIPQDTIYKHLSGNNLSAIIKASLFGVPLPLCSCGVIPVTAHLRKEGAGKGAAMSFLISTPSTGIDSIMATYSLLGLLFAIIRPIAAFFNGILGGFMINLFDKDENKPLSNNFSCSICNDIHPHSHGIFEKIKKMFKYAYFDLIEDTGKWLLIGIGLGGLISFLLPSNLVQEYLSNPLWAYPLMIIIGIPMYVCATGSIPIAASLIAKGMSPGAGLIFLITGPATNSATISFVLGKLGKKSFFVYLLSIIFTSILFALLIDYIILPSGNHTHLMSHSKMLPEWLKIGSAILLSLFIVKSLIKKSDKEINGMGKVYKVPDIECNHCAKTIKDAFSKIKGVEEVRVDIKKKEVQVTGEASDQLIKQTIKEAGYTVDEENQK